MAFGSQGPVPHQMVQIIDQTFSCITVRYIILRLIIAPDLIFSGRMKGKPQTALRTFIDIEKITTYRMVLNFQYKPAIDAVTNRAFDRGLGCWIHRVGLIRLRAVYFFTWTDC